MVTAVSTHVFVIVDVVLNWWFWLKCEQTIYMKLAEPSCTFIDSLRGIRWGVRHRRTNTGAWILGQVCREVEIFHLFIIFVADIVFSLHDYEEGSGGGLTKIGELMYAMDSSVYRKADTKER
jgi:hypothetical protein